MEETQDIKDLVDNLLGETLDETLFLQLANIVKDRREDLRQWVFLKKLDSSNTASNTPITLPTDFKIERKIRVGTMTYTPVPYEEKDLYIVSQRLYSIDYATNTLYILGAQTGQTVYIYYIRTTPEITLSPSVTPVWPARFWPLLAFDIVGINEAGIDADDIYARMSVENKNQAFLLADGMANWDNQLQHKSQNNRVGVADSDPIIDLGMW